MLETSFAGSREAFVTLRSDPGCLDDILDKGAQRKAASQDRHSAIVDEDGV
ncbi:MAG: hypothetical protein P8X85_15650 [Desulfobacterales bacterium]